MLAAGIMKSTMRKCLGNPESMFYLCLPTSSGSYNVQEIKSCLGIVDLFVSSFSSNMISIVSLRYYLKLQNLQLKKAFLCVSLLLYSVTN